jgi:hypothetical protein
MQKNYYAIIPANVRYDKELPSSAKLLYGELTALSNEKGFCWATNEYFAELYGVHNKSISRLISQLEKKGYVKSELIFEGKQVKERHIYITSENSNVTTSTQNCSEGMNKIVTTPSHKIVTDNNTSFNNTNNNTLHEQFETFWLVYPRKVDKKRAGKSFLSAIKKHSFEQILTGTKVYAIQCKRENTEQKFIKHASTYLNNECYLEFNETPKQPEPPNRPLNSMSIG